MKTVKNIILFFAGFCIYITIECCYRGFSSPVMGILGGLAIVLIDKINDYISWNIDLSIQMLMGGAAITIMELIIGAIAKYTSLLPIMWDYSHLPLNFHGIICAQFSACWVLLSAVAIFIADAINYYLLEETCVPHYKFFGKYFEFHTKKCDQRKYNY